MKKISIVCVYNDLNQYNKLCESLEKQTVVCELVGIDNRGHRFLSNSEAFNSVINSINTEFVVFCHQDIIFPNEHSLELFLNDMEKINESDLIGSAGVTFRTSGIVSNLKNKPDSDFVGRRRLNQIEETNVLDECLFGGRTSRFKKRLFDEKLCDGWHLYAVDQCIYNYIRGDKVFISPVTMYHASAGIPKKDFFDNFNRMCKRYHKDIKFIRTCTWESYTNWFSRSLNWLEWNIFKILKGIK